MEQYTDNRRTDNRRADNRRTDNRRTDNRRNVDGRMSEQEAILRRDRLRRQKIRKAKLKRRRMIVFSIMGFLAILLVSGIGYGIYCILDVDYVAEATELYMAEDYENAVISFQKAVEKGDDLDEAYLGIAYCSWELGDYETMESAFDLAYSNGAEMTGASRSLLASISLAEEDYETALEYIQEALSLDGNSEALTQELLSNEIACYEFLGEWDMAAAKMEVYVATYPDDEEAAEEWEFLQTR